MKRLILASALAVLIGVPSGWVIAMLLTPALWRLEPILHFGAWSRSCIWNWPVTPVRLIGFFTCVVDRDPFVIRHLLGLAPPQVWHESRASRLRLQNSIASSYMLFLALSPLLWPVRQEKQLEP